MNARSSARAAALAGLVSTACGGSAPSPQAGAPAASASADSSKQETSWGAPLPPAAAAVEAMPESVVQLSFEPLVTGVRPGSRFRLAAHFRITPGYRISWKLAGDLGQPTVVTFRAPPGFEVGPVEFPVPERYTDPGGYVGYGYAKETAVFVEVKAPGNLRGGDVHRFDLEASWVACKKQCATERTAAFVELATTRGNARAEETEAELAPFLARVPQPLANTKDAEQVWEVGGKGATLVVKLPDATPRDFFSDGTATPAPMKTTMADGEVRFRYDEAPTPGSRPLRGVIVATIAGKETPIELEASLPGAEKDTADEANGKPAKTGKAGTQGSLVTKQGKQGKQGKQSKQSKQGKPASRRPR